MKRALGILTAVVATCALGIAVVSPAGAYPPVPPSLSTPTPTVHVEEPITLTASGFVGGSLLTFTIGGTSAGTATADSRGVATIVASSRPAPGTFGITATSPDGVAAGVFGRSFTAKELARRTYRVMFEHGVDQPTLAAWREALGNGRLAKDLMGDDVADDIADPYGKSLAEHRRTADELDALMAVIARSIAAWLGSLLGTRRTGRQEI